MTNHFNGLTEAEAERLALLIEECAEVQKAATKILRHGYDSDNRGQLKETNRAALTREMGDLMHASERLMYAGDVRGEDAAAHADRKAEEIHSWLHHQ